MKIRPSRAIFCLVLVLMISAILGGVFGGQVKAAMALRVRPETSGASIVVA